MTRVVAWALAGSLLLTGCGRQAPPPPPPAARPTVAAVEPSEADTVILTPDFRAIPGAHATRLLRFSNPAAHEVQVAGSWDYWSAPTPMVPHEGVWELDTAQLHLAIGRYEYKFVSDGVWEPGDNRVLYVNLMGLLERPSDIIYAARLEALDRIDILFRRDPPHTNAVQVRLLPDIPVTSAIWRAARGTHRTMGCAVAGDFVTFTMDEARYDLSLDTNELVTVAGTFNGWRPDGVSGQWQLHDDDNDGAWTGTVRMDGLSVGQLRDDLLFKFVINNERWLPPPVAALNAVPDGRGNLNLRIDPQLSASTVLEVHTAKPLTLSESYIVVVDGLLPGTTFREVSPGGALDGIRSDLPLGPQLGGSGKTTEFRLFAPRASHIELHLYDGPYFRPPEGGDILPPRSAFTMQHRDDGVWDVEVPGLTPGQYYVFHVDGPPGAGEGFSPFARVGDPYARAVAHSDNNSIVIDPLATNDWFSGWSDQGHRMTTLANAVIYETHVRDLTVDPSSGVAEPLRGKYAGVLASAGTGTGLDHLKALGVNTIELMPISEFMNGSNRYDWGYGPTYYFAPEASYAQAPLQGSQYYEFKHLVNDLHRQGFTVIMDVVYNHIGSPNVFQMLDRKYFLRQDQDYNLSNFSGCGNDVRSEAPMMRRLIIDNILYWMREHHVDGFRFDLAELIDMETLLAVRDAARAQNPDVILISEPWSFRGDHRQQLKGKGWAAWNGDFRRVVQRFVRGEGNRDDLVGQIRGCVDSWAATPLQAINYLESHDDMAFADEISSAANRDGRQLSAQDAARNRLGATILFTALGVPMLAEGQEWIRSKQGLHNTFDQGDAVNALRWKERERPEAAETLAYYRALVRLRSSKAGQSFRWTQEIPPDYIDWIRPDDGRAIGYIINGNRKRPGTGFVILLNAADKPVDFNVRFPPGGSWRLIGNGRRMDARGIPEGAPRPLPDGTRTVTVPAGASFIFAGV